MTCGATAGRGTIHGKRVDLGLGGWPLVSLAEARQAAFDYKKLAREGGDPRSLRPGQGAPTFAEATETVIAIHESGWKDGGKSASQWRASLRDYASPRLGKLRVSDISTADVMAVLLPIWNAKPETARRVRQRIGAIMKWAVAQGGTGKTILPATSSARRCRRTVLSRSTIATCRTVRSPRRFPRYGRRARTGRLSPRSNS